MDDFDNFTKKAKLALFRIVEVLALTVAILLLLYLLLGEASGSYITSVAVNVSLFISAVTPEALAAVALGIALYSCLRLLPAEGTIAIKLQLQAQEPQQS